jgi:putative peptidoglycan lipid II flippase
LFTMLANVLLNLIFLFYFFAKLKNGGPALASALAGYFNVFTLFIIFRLRFGRLGTSEIAASLGKIAICASAMGVVCWSALRYSQFDTIEHFGPRLLVFIGLIVSATLTYLAVAWILRCDEISEVYGIAFHSVGAEPGKQGIVG